MYMDLAEMEFFRNFTASKRGARGAVNHIFLNLSTLHTHFLRIALLFAALASVCMPAMGQEEFHRDLEYVQFVPKGAWVAGVSVSYSQSDQDNYQFLVFEHLNGDTYTFKVSPTVMFCFKDNLTAGGRFSYSRQRTRLNSADIVLGADTEYNIDNLYSISHSYHGTALFRNYMSLGRSTRFGLFNEVQIEIGGGQAKICSGAGDSLTGTYQRSFNFNVGLAPGLAVFLNNYSAIEVNVGVLGFNYTSTRAVTDQIYVANLNTKSANFKINLFSITFGVMFYI